MHVISEEQDLTYFEMLRTKCKKLYVSNDLQEKLATKIKQRSRLLYQRELKHGYGQRIMLSVVAEQVSRELALIAYKRDRRRYNDICEHYGLPKIHTDDADFRRDLKQEQLAAGGYITRKQIEEGDRFLAALPPAYGINKL